MSVAGFEPAFDLVTQLCQILLLLYFIAGSVFTFRYTLKLLLITKTFKATQHQNLQSHTS